MSLQCPSSSPNDSRDTCLIKVTSHDVDVACNGAQVVEGLLVADIAGAYDLLYLARDLRHEPIRMSKETRTEKR